MILKFQNINYDNRWSVGDVQQSIAQVCCSDLILFDCIHNIQIKH